MKVHVLLFGATAEIVGSREISLEIDEQSSTASVLNILCEQYPPLSTMKLLIAVNEKYADARTVINNGDKIAIFTPVSGG